MESIQDLANRFFPLNGDHSNKVYNKRLCEQVKQLIEFHCNEQLKAILENADLGNAKDYDHQMEINDSIINAYPLENIK